VASTYVANQRPGRGGLVQGSLPGLGHRRLSL